jgi:phosphate-selective porin OprO and OprP
MRFVTVVVAVIMAAASVTYAQSPAPVTTGFQDGFFIQSADGDHRLMFGALVQEDGRFAVDDPLPITNTFTLRKLRPTLTGRIARYFDFRLMPDFGNGTTVVYDAYFDVRFSPKLRLRLGKDKTPVGYELLLGDPFLLFPERSLASSLVPNRDIGIQAQGDIGAGRLLYSAGIFNGVPDGSNSTTEVDANSDKDVAARVTLQPFRGRTPAGALNGLGVHLGGSHGDQTGALPAFRTSVGQTYFSYAVGTIASGSRTRVTPAVFYYYKGFGGFAEYVRSTQTVSRAATTRDVTNTAWGVTGSYVVTGEATSDRGVRPRAPFDPANGHWGALQLLARYSELTLEDELFAAGFGAAGASRAAHQWTLGANWYPVQWVKWYATFERTTFGNDARFARPAEDVILFRFQLAF